MLRIPLVEYVTNEEVFRKLATTTYSYNQKEIVLISCMHNEEIRARELNTHSVYWRQGKQQVTYLTSSYEWIAEQGQSMIMG